MKVDVMLGSRPLRKVDPTARTVTSAGFAGAVVTEAGRTAYLTCAELALRSDLDILTGIAVAFPRSPMVTAQVAWELAEASAGRFRLGLGTQVRAHVERRFGVAFDRPGSRLRDYVLAVRAIFASFRTGEPLSHHGDFYDLSLLPQMWSPGPIDAPDPPIDVAAVSPWMLRMAGEVADGVHIHPLNTPTYLRDFVLPNLAIGAARSGRSPDDLEIIAPAFIVVGDTDEEQHRWRELARSQVAFYGSTPNYAFIFDQLGYDGTTARIREGQKKGDLAAMTAVVTDEILDHFIMSSTWGGLAAALLSRYGGVATRVVSYFGTMALEDNPDAIAQWRTVNQQLKAAGS